MTRLKHLAGAAAISLALLVGSSLALNAYTQYYHIAGWTYAGGDRALGYAYDSVETPTSVLIWCDPGSPTCFYIDGPWLIVYDDGVAKSGIEGHEVLKK